MSSKMKQLLEKERAIHKKTESLKWLVIKSYLPGNIHLKGKRFSAHLQAIKDKELILISNF